jgi:hypothetical protein
MIPVCGKPIIEHEVELCRRYGFTDFLLIIGYMGDQVSSFFGDGSKWGVNIEYYQETQPLGTAGALGYLKDKLQGVEWICFGANPFNTVIPIYTSVKKLPKYLTDVTTEVSTENFYWGSRLIGALADHCYGECIQHIERYQLAVPAKGHNFLNEYDKKVTKTKLYILLEEANQLICDMAKKDTIATLNNVLYQASLTMKCNYQRSDN